MVKTAQCGKLYLENYSHEFDIRQKKLEVEYHSF